LNARRRLIYVFGAIISGVHWAARHGAVAEGEGWVRQARFRQLLREGPAFNVSYRPGEFRKFTLTRSRRLAQTRERRTEPTPHGAAAKIGQTLGHYRIDSKLGEGGMGVVYRAFDTHLDRAVAIKVLRPEATVSPERKRRFVQEAKSASALNHPNIIHIYDIDTANLPDGPTDFIAMEFVPGDARPYIGKVD
jgi:serine/threonine protein kinase